MCCRLHWWHYERGTKILYQTRQDAVSVETVGTTYVLLESIQTKISICCRLHGWHYERGTKVLHQTRQGAVIVEKVGTTYLLLDSIQIKIDVLSFTLVALGARNKDIISDQARCSKCGNSRNYLRSTRINTNKNIDMLSFTWMAL